MAQPETEGGAGTAAARQADAEAAARELVACPDCTANRGEWCRDRAGQPCDQHPRRIDAAALRAAELKGPGA